MYNDFYGLKEKPFSLTPDPKFLYLSSRHREVMEYLNFGLLQREGFILITGDIGTGKTTICRALLNRLHEETPVALMLNPFSSEEELLRYILSDLGISPSGQTKLELLEELNRFLLRQSSAGRVPVLIIDEAQNLSFSLLEQVRILSNLETEKEKLLQIILVGQEELREKLKLPKLRQLDQRISVRYHLRPLDRKEIPRYIDHRLMVAGSQGGISFSGGALREIFNFSRGVPRLINMVCDRTLLNGYVKGDYRLSAAMVRQAAKTLRDEEKIPLIPVRIRLAAVGLVLFLFFLGVLVFFFFPREVKESLKSFFPQKFSSSAKGPQKFQVSPDKSAPNALPKPAEKLYAYRFDKSLPYTLHVGSYRTEEMALEIIQNLEALSHPKYISKLVSPEGGVWYRVLVGKFKTQKEAQEAREEVKKKKGLEYVKVMEVIPGEGSNEPHS